ncbi:ABC transporter substrate-binding protein [Methylobacterium sp. Gmos1]
MRYRFSLRPNVRWHDGKPFTAADVRFSLLALKKIGPRGRITFANLVEVETPDPLTAIPVPSKSTPYLLKALTAAESPIVPVHPYPGEPYGDSPNGSAPIGTGPSSPSGRGAATSSFAATRITGSPAGPSSTGS